MKARMIFVLGAISFLVFTNRSLTFSQESQGNIERGGVISDSTLEPEMQWVWAEAVSVDSQKKTVLVKYLDYETDQEKEITIDIDDKTTYENINSIDSIQPKDVLSIDYMLNPDGRNVAKNISVEKSENMPPAQEENIIEETEVSPPVVEEGPQVVTTAQ